MLFVASVAVGHAHLAAPPEIHRVQEAADTFGNEMRMVHGERPAEARRLNAAKVFATLLEVVGEVADLGMFRLSIEVLEQEARPGPLGERSRAVQALEAGGAAGGVVAGEVIAAMDDDPAGAETPRELEVRLEVSIGRVG